MPVTVYASPHLLPVSCFPNSSPLFLWPRALSRATVFCYAVIHRVFITSLDTKYLLSVQSLYYTSYFSCTPFLQPTQIMMVVGRDISETISHLKAAF